MKVESGYSYDGNRTTVYLNKGAMGQETQEYAHNIVNQYTTIDRSIIGLPLGGSVGYDDNGNLTTDKEGYGYSYDYRNRIEEIEEVVQFSYDALGRRIRKTDSQSNITTYYIYDPDNRIIAQYTKPLNDEASLDRTFVYGNDLHEVLAMFLARNEGNPADWDAFLEFVDAWLCTDPNDACYDAAYDHNSDNIVNLVDFAYFAGIWDIPSNRESNWYYLHDVQGSAMGIIGGRLNRPEDREFYTYDVYGNPSSLSAVRNPFMFHGKFAASTSPLVYSRFYRDYKPELGRWMQFDPIGYADGTNLYEFVGTNPTNLIDLTGLRIVRLVFAYEYKNQETRRYVPPLSKIQGVIQQILSPCFTDLKCDQVRIICKEQNGSPTLKGITKGEMSDKPIMYLQHIYLSDLEGNATNLGIADGPNATIFAKRIDNAINQKSAQEARERRQNLHIIFANITIHESLWHGMLDKWDNFFAEPGSFGSTAANFQPIKMTESDCKKIRNSLEVK